MVNTGMLAGVHRYKIWGAVAFLWILAFLYLRSPNYSPITFQAPAIPKPRKSWTRKPDKYPVDEQSLVRLPDKRPGIKVPKVQVSQPSEDSTSRKRRHARLEAVRESWLHSWRGYAEHAWMHDELTPYAGKYKDPLGGWAATLVDSLDMLWILGLKPEFEQAVTAATAIDFSRCKSPVINVFETNVRYLGGFLGAYEISNRRYPILLTKAIEVADLLMCAFDTPNRMPITRWQWKQYAGGADQVAHQQELVAEIGSLSLEFTKLSMLTGDPRYYDAIKRVADQFESVQLDTRLPGMWPVVVDALTPSFHTGSDFTLGSMSNTIYEYLPKQYLILGGLIEQPRHLYENFIYAAKKHLFQRALTPWSKPVVIPVDLQVTDSGDDKKYKLTYKAQHVACFAGGMVGLAGRIFERAQELELAAQLTDGCVWAYNTTNSGIAPESFTFIPCGSLLDTDPQKECVWSGGRWLKAVEDHHASEFVKPQGEQAEKWTKPSVQHLVDRLNIPKGVAIINDGRYNLRPEAIESVFIMYRITGDPKWMEKAWVMFTHIEKATRTDIAASAVDDVTKKQPVKLDGMESFWLAETLKYFYLIFSDFDVLSLDTWVLNAEGHPLRRADA